MQKMAKQQTWAFLQGVGDPQQEGGRGKLGAEHRRERGLTLKLGKGPVKLPTRSRPAKPRGAGTFLGFGVAGRLLLCPTLGTLVFHAQTPWQHRTT